MSEQASQEKVRQMEIAGRTFREGGGFVLLCEGGSGVHVEVDIHSDPPAVWLRALEESGLWLVAPDGALLPTSEEGEEILVGVPLTVAGLVEPHSFAGRLASKPDAYLQLDGFAGVEWNHFDRPDADGDMLGAGSRAVPRHDAPAVRIEISPGTSAEDAKRLLRKLLVWVEKDMAASLSDAPQEPPPPFPAATVRAPQAAEGTG